MAGIVHPTSIKVLALERRIIVFKMGSDIYMVNTIKFGGKPACGTYVDRLGNFHRVTTRERERFHKPRGDGIVPPSNIDIIFSELSKLLWSGSIAEGETYDFKDRIDEAQKPWR